jgi:hypothetical protein
MNSEEYDRNFNMAEMQPALNERQLMLFEIATELNQESHRIWDSAKMIKNQDYHDGVVKGLKMASKFVMKL